MSGTFSIKKLAIIGHDLAMTALAVIFSLMIRFDDAQQALRFARIGGLLVFFVCFAGLVYGYFGLYRSKWRFASLPDLASIAKAVAVLALSALVLDYILVGQDFYGFYFFGRQTIAVYALIQTALLGGPRLAYRYWKDSSRRQNEESRAKAAPALLLGRSVDADFALRAFESGNLKGILPKAILSPRAGDQGQSIRTIPVVGTLDDLEAIVADFAANGVIIRRLVLTASALTADAEPEKLFQRARKLGLALSRLDAIGEDRAEIAPVQIEDLLLRPTVEIDRLRLEAFLKHKQVAITGGGGSIGSEVCLKVASFGASAILVLENSEPALHAITEQLLAQDRQTKILGHICDVRDRQRLCDILENFRPDVVFHAAALKHVPYLELDWEEGIRTNITGSMNCADAAVKAGASAFVMISTDKAIQPVSMLGATKRFAEIYTEALDEKLRLEGGKTRLISVRFGNVLGSNGSVVPKFKAQIERGGPITVTHPDMVRYFMTVGEAADLVLTAATHAKNETTATAAPLRASVYVLKMGQPVKIVDLARRMIQLSGFEPGVDMDVAITGARPGERLNEILFAQDEKMVDIGVEGVLAAQTIGASLTVIAGWTERLTKAITQHDRASAEKVLEEAIPSFAERELQKPKEL